MRINLFTLFLGFVLNRLNTVFINTSSVCQTTSGIGPPTKMTWLFNLTKL